jgi:hypothetical protein
VETASTEAAIVSFSIMNLQRPPENSDSEFRSRALLEKSLRRIGQVQVQVNGRLKIRMVELFL